jgi:DNA-directed RNA polymerase III subunit RPC1
MSRMAKLAARYLCDFGFSIGIGDVMPTSNLTKLKAALIRDGTARCPQAPEP